MCKRETIEPYDDWGIAIKYGYKTLGIYPRDAFDPHIPRCQYCGVQVGNSITCPNCGFRLEK